MTPIDTLHANKIAKAVLLYVFKIPFQASLLLEVLLLVNPHGVKKVPLPAGQIAFICPAVQCLPGDEGQEKGDPTPSTLERTCLSSSNQLGEPL